MLLTFPRNRTCTFLFFQKPQRLLPANLYVVLYNFRARQSDELDLRLVASNTFLALLFVYFMFILAHCSINITPDRINFFVDSRSDEITTAYVLK